MHSVVQWSVVMKMVATPSPVRQLVPSVPHLTSGASVMIVPSLTGQGGVRDTGGRERAGLPHQAVDPPLRRSDRLQPQPGPYRAVALADKGRGGDHLADVLGELRVGVGLGTPLLWLLRRRAVFGPAPVERGGRDPRYWQTRSMP